MVLTPRLPFDHVVVRDIIAKRQFSSGCTNECSASLAALQNPTNTLAFCTNTFVDGFQTCVNCLAASGLYDASYFTTLKSSMDSIASSCSALGSPVSHSITIPALGNGGANTGGVPTATGTGNSPNPTKSGDNNSSNSSGPPIGAIVGGVVGGVALIVIIALLVFWLKRRNSNNPPAPTPGNFAPTGPVHDPNKPQVGPGPQLNAQGYYHVPQSTGTPPPMQQYNNMGIAPGGQSGPYNPNAQPWQPQGPTGNTQYATTQFDPRSSYAPTTGSQQQFGQPQMNPNPGFVAATMHDNRTSTYAPSTYTTNTNAPYQPPFSPGPMTVTSSTGSQRVPSPPALSNSPGPLIVPQQYPITENYTHADVPAPAPVPVPGPAPGPGVSVDSPPAYEGANLPGASSASAPAALSQAEVELISQRVANIMNANGQAPDAAHIGKLVGEQQRKN